MPDASLTLAALESLAEQVLSIFDIDSLHKVNRFTILINYSLYN